MSVEQLHGETATMQSYVEELGPRIEEGFPMLDRARLIIEQALIQMNASMAYDVANVDADENGDNIVITTFAKLDFFYNNKWRNQVEPLRRRLRHCFDRVLPYVAECGRDVELEDLGNMQCSGFLLWKS